MDFITTSATMLKLGLPLRERTAFAIIYSFSQEGEGCWWGSLNTMAEWLDCTKRNAIRVLKRLEFEGLVAKRETYENGVKRCIYYATPEAVKLVHQGGDIASPGVVTSGHQGGDIASPGVVTSGHQGGDIVSPNNKDRYIKKDNKGDNIYTPTPSKFDFYKALINEGVNPQTASDWLVVRKAKRCVNSEIAWQATLNEIRKSGYSPEHCIREAVVRSWAGFKAEWLQREENGTGPARARKVDPVTYMVRQMQREQEMRQYNPQDDLPNIDEQ